MATKEVPYVCHVDQAVRSHRKLGARVDLALWVRGRCEFFQAGSLCNGVSADSSLVSGAHTCILCAATMPFAT